MENTLSFLSCPICPQTTLHSFEETGEHLSIVHHLSFSAHIFASYMWSDNLGYQQMKLIMKDVAIMNQVLRNMKVNVENLEDRVKAQESGLMANTSGSGTSHVATQTEEYLENFKIGKIESITEDDELELKDERIKLESKQDDDDIVDEENSCQNLLHIDELEFFKKLYSEKEKQMLGQHVQIKALERKIEALEVFKTESAEKMAEAVKKSGLQLIRNVRNQFTILEDDIKCAEEGRTKLPNDSMNYQSQVPSSSMSVGKVAGDVLIDAGKVGVDSFGDGDIESHHARRLSGEKRKFGD